MKKTYKKPTIQIENFVMDIDIMSSDALYDSLRAGFEAYNGDDNKITWEDYLAVSGYDNSTSGYCYTSAYIPS